MNKLDWNLVCAFHATATTGSLSAAALRLGLTQPTMSRQIATLEAELDLELFARSARRLTLTQTGKSLLKLTEPMAETAEAISLTAKGHAQEVEGEVIVSATDSFSQYILPNIIERLRVKRRWFP